MVERATQGAEAWSRLNAFSALLRDPCAAPWPFPAAEAALCDRSSASGVCPEVAPWFAFP